MPAAPRCVGHPFSDPARVPGLYADQGRVARRSGALLSAKTHGRHVGRAIADIAATNTTTPDHSVIADIGCGWGGTTAVLCERFPPARLLAVDASAAMLHHAQARLCVHADRVAFLRADFHHLPLEERSGGLAVAAFCLYHSPQPDQVTAEIARCLAPGGIAILITKSTDSYHELDELVASIVVHALLNSGAVAAPAFTAAEALRTLESAAADPACIYKDSNPRNFLITTTGTVAGRPADAHAQVLVEIVAQRQAWRGERDNRWRRRRGCGCLRNGSMWRMPW